MLTASHLRFQWPSQPTPTLAIESFQLAQGEKLFLYGPSGSGKSTLLGLLAGIHGLQQGSITMLGRQLNTLSAAKRDHFRADHIGTIFQNFNLLPYLNPLENVLLGCSFSTLRSNKAKATSGSCQQEAQRLLTELGLDASTWTRSVAELSIGQQQRVAAARALIREPELIIADEPTSALDSESEEAVTQAMNRLFE